MKALAKNFEGHWAQVILGPLFKLFEAILELLVPLVMADIIDIGINSQDTQYVILGGLIMLGLAVLGAAAGLTCQYFAAVAAGNFGLRLRRQLFGHILTLSAAETERFGAGGLVTRLTNDTVQVQIGVNMFIRLATRVPYLAIGSIVMAFTINVRAGVVFLTATPLIALILFVIMRRTLPSYGLIQQQQDNLSGLAGENLEGVRVIRAFSRQGAERRQFADANDDLTRRVIRVGRISAALNPMTSVIANLAVVLLVWMGASFVFGGSMLPGEIIALVNYMNQILLSLILAANLIVIFTRALASAKRVTEVLELSPTVADGPGAQPQAAEPAVRFDDVSFRYHEEADDALAHISFSLEPGGTLGIIGGTGSGKSTIGRLILRYYDVQQGSLRVAGSDVKDYTLQQLRAGIGYVPQGPKLFSGTLRENLRLSAPGAADAQLWDALAAAQAADFVRESGQGLELTIEEGGANLSGGQRQRLTIARALVRQPSLLILDDAASALDFATEARLRRALAQLGAHSGDARQSMTIITISQRVSSVMNADSILVLDDGRVDSLGSHAELLKSSALYREICDSQGVLV